MLNANKLALQAARKIVAGYKHSNAMLYHEYRGAYRTLKLAVDNGWIFESYSFGDGGRLYMNYMNENGDTLRIPFFEYTEKLVCEAFFKAFFAAKNLNALCFGK